MNKKNQPVDFYGAKKQQEAPFFSSAILKLTEYCNIRCTYCYMFENPHEHSKGFPLRLSDDDAAKFVERVAEYIDAKNISRFRITLHGGEPTLWPIDSFEKLFRRVEAANIQNRVAFSMQSNLVQLNKDLFPILKENMCSIGVSIDGPEVYHDSRRITHGGKGTYSKIIKNVDWILKSEYSKLLAGYLTVANPEIPVNEYLDWATELQPSKLSVLWPIEFNHNNKPSDGRYGKWYSELFGEWLKRDIPSLKIRYFQETVSTMCGSSVHGDSLGVNGLGMVVIDTDGSYVHHDYLRGFLPEIRLHRSIKNTSLFKLEEDSLLRTLKNRMSLIPDECLSCTHVGVCGGGFIANRLHGTNVNFDRKSIMCEDHKMYFGTVRRLLAAYGAEVSL